MSSEHIVLPVEHCNSHDNGLHEGVPPCLDPTDQAVIWNRGRCGGCLRDGRRALLDQAVPVEQGRATYAKRMSDGHMSLIVRDGEGWWPVEVES